MLRRGSSPCIPCSISILQRPVVSSSIRAGIRIAVSAIGSVGSRAVVSTVPLLVLCVVVGWRCGLQACTGMVTLESVLQTVVQTTLLTDNGYGRTVFASLEVARVCVDGF